LVEWEAEGEAKRLGNRWQIGKDNLAEDVRKKLYPAE